MSAWTYMDFQKKIGLSFMVDTNKDREITFDKDFSKLDDKETFGIIILYIKRNIFKI